MPSRLLPSLFLPWSLPDYIPWMVMYHERSPSCAFCFLCIYPWACVYAVSAWCLSSAMSGPRDTVVTKGSHVCQPPALEEVTFTPPDLRGHVVFSVWQWHCPSTPVFVSTSVYYPAQCAAFSCLRFSYRASGPRDLFCCFISCLSCFFPYSGLFEYFCCLST